MAKTLFGTKLGLGLGHIVLDGTHLPQKKRGTVAPQFSVHVYFGQTAAWVKMKVGMQVGLGRGHCVRWGPAFPKGAKPPNFQVMSVVAQRLGGSRCHLVGR